MEFIKSNRGGNKVLYEGYIYVKQKDLADGAVSYECEMRRNDQQCKAKLKVLGNEVLGRMNEHTHAPNLGRMEATKVKVGVKRRALETEESAQQIISQELSDISESAAVNLPAIRNIRRNIRRNRQIAGNPLPIPNTRSQLVIPDDYKQTLRHEQFLLFDSGPDEDRILIFGTQSTLQKLQESEAWFCDGTFKVVPSIFYQLFTIHGLMHGHVVPCVFALLPNKRQDTYERLFQALRELQDGLSPRSVMIDFELATRNALQQAFPDVVVKGCFYHLSQSIYRKIQAHGLQESYSADPDLNISVRMIAALSFVPVGSVIAAFEALQKEVPAALEPVMDYFEDNFIGRLQRNRRKQPTFALDMWNIHDRVEDDLPRTNNNVEGWHRHMQANVGAHHANIFQFMKILKREQALTELTLVRINAGELPAPSKRKYAALTQRLQTLVGDYQNRDMLDFLRGIAHNLQL